MHEQEVVRRPVRLEVRIAARAGEVELVLVGVDHVGVGVRIEMRDDLCQRIGRQLVVMVEQGDEFAAAPSSSAAFEAAEMPAFTER